MRNKMDILNQVEVIVIAMILLPLFLMVIFK